MSRGCATIGRQAPSSTTGIRHFSTAADRVTLSEVRTPLEDLLGQSGPLVRVREQAERLLQRHAGGGRRLPPLLILGETGTGKGLLAGAIHRAGPRATGPFVDVNCAAIPATLIEAELFGFERGAFTDARQAKAGLFQAANRGTLFLDEVGLLPDGLQAKLLKVLEERAVRRLGSTRTEPVDVWVIAATSEDLEEAMRARRFREDLYHRLAVVTLALPPLRARGDDVVRLGAHFLARSCDDYGLAPRTLAADAVAALRAYAWPGNVRELANVMERVALLADGTAVTAATLSLPASPAPPPPAPSVASERRAAAKAHAEAERGRLLEALRATNWNLSRAAARLGLPRNTLRYRMDKLGLGSDADAPPPTGPAPSERAPTPAPAGPPPEPAVSDTPPPLHPTGRGRVPAAIRWEARRVTLLAARLVAPPVPSGPSEASWILELLVEKVQSFGGQVDELGAAGLVAAFGLEPVDDTPRHAASAALAIQKLAADPYPDDPVPSAGIAVALHTELVAVGRHHGDVGIEADAKQRAYARLKRLVDRAAPGAVVVSSQAAGALARRFELFPLGSEAGVADEVYRLVAASEADRALTGFVGREAELRLLRDRFDRARAGQGQVVSISGEAGIGKTRLLRELRRQLPGEATWMEGQAISFGRTLAFHPLIDLLRRAFALEEGDHPAAVAAKVEQAVRQLSEDLEPTLPSVRYLLSLDPGEPTLLQLDPKLRRAELFDAMRTLFVRAASRRPLVLVWEDLHWTDQATEAFLTLLGDTVAAHPILMVLTYRPGYTPPVGDRTFHTRVALPVLTTADSVAMALGLLSVDELPEALQTLLIRRAEGNPFFVEEVLRSLQETGVIEVGGKQLRLARNLAEIVVPDTVQDVILARIQRLGDAARQILEVASVIGREFGRRLVDRVVEPAGGNETPLRELTAAELVQERQPAPELTYAFTHALTHEVVYGSLPPPRRADLHRQVGLAIEALYADRLSGYEELLAHHFSKAGEWPKALAFLARAGAKAARAFAVREARALYDQALEAAGRPGGLADLGAVSEIHEARAGLYFIVSEFDRSRAEAERVMLLARQAGDRTREAQALAAIGWAATWARDLEGSEAHARQAIAVAGPGGGDTVARAEFIIGFVRAVSGGLDEARVAIDRALVTSLESSEWTARSLSLSVAGLLKNWEGQYEAASGLQAEGLALAREHHLLVPLLFNFFLQGMTLTGKGDYEGARRLFREGLGFAEKVGDEAIHHRLLNCLGWLHAELGDLDGAVELNRRSAEVGRRRNDPGTFPNAEVNLGEVYLAKGDLAAAWEHLESAYRFWGDPHASAWMRWRYSMRLFASLGELWLARGDPARATEFADRCLDLATRTNSRKNLAKGWRLRGDIALARRALDDAGTAYRQALTVAEAIGNPTQLWRTHVAWARLCAVRRQPVEAGQAYRAAREVLGRVKASLQDPALRASLDAAPDVREVYDRAASADA
jgi:DNA-binding NtrC family response regulator/tetratricopeptide (TPR) repeat protein